MAKSEALGYCECPECGYERAEIKKDKKGFFYRWCPNSDCNAQYFTRKQSSSDRLGAKILGAKPQENSQNNPVTDTGNIQTPPESKPVAKKSFDLGDL